MRSMKSEGLDDWVISRIASVIKTLLEELHKIEQTNARTVCEEYLILSVDDIASQGLSMKSHVANVAEQLLRSGLQTGNTKK